MSALLIVLLVAIAVIALAQAGRQARAGRRAVQDHHRALDTLGHIATSTGSEPAHMGDADHEVAHAHVRVVDADSAPPSRWARQRARARRASAAWYTGGRQRAGDATDRARSPDGVDESGTADDDGPTTMEVEIPPSPARAGLPPPPVPAPPERRSAAPAGEHGPPPTAVAPPPVVAVPPRPPVVPYQEPVTARHAPQRPVARIEDFTPSEVPPFVPPEPTSHPFVGSPRAPSNHETAPSADARVLDRVPEAAIARRKLSLRRRHQSQPSFRRRGGRSRSRSRHRGRLGVAAAALIVVAGGGVGAAVSVRPWSGHAAPAPTSGAAPSRAAPTTTTTTVPPVRLVSVTAGQATYQVTGTPTTTVSASARCWVEARSAGPTGPVVFQGVLSPGQTRDLNGALWLRLGNPAAASVTVNGTPLKPPGLSSSQPYEFVVS